MNDKKIPLVTRNLSMLFTEFETHQSGLTDDEAKKRIPKTNFPTKILISDIFLFIYFCLTGVFGVFYRFWWTSASIFLLFLCTALFRFFALKRIKRYPEILKDIIVRKVKIIRNGVWNVVGWGEVVRGDIVELRGGDLVFAKVHLYDGERLVVEEPRGNTELILKFPFFLSKDENSSVVLPGSLVVGGVCRGIAEDSPLVYLNEIFKRRKFENVGVLKFLFYTFVFISLFLFIFFLAQRKIENSFFFSILSSPIPIYLLWNYYIVKSIERMKRKGFLADAISSYESITGLFYFFFDYDAPLLRRENYISLFCVNDEILPLLPDGTIEFKGLNSEHNRESIGLILKIGVLLGNAFYIERYAKLDSSLISFAEKVGISYENLTEKEFSFRSMVIVDGAKAGFFKTSKGERIFLVYGTPEKIIKASSFSIFHSAVVPFSKSSAHSLLDFAERLRENSLEPIAYAYKFIEGFEEGVNYFDSLVFVGLSAFGESFCEDIQKIRRGFEKLGIKPVAIVDSNEKERKLALLKRNRWFHQESEVLRYDDFVAGMLKREKNDLPAVLFDVPVEESIGYIDKTWGKKAAFLGRDTKLRGSSKNRCIRFAELFSAHLSGMNSNIFFGGESEKGSAFIMFFESALDLTKKLNSGALLIVWTLFGGLVSFLSYFLFSGTIEFSYFQLEILTIMILLLTIAGVLLPEHQSNKRIRLNRFLYFAYGGVVNPFLSLIGYLAYKKEAQEEMNLLGAIFFFFFIVSVFEVSFIYEPFFKPNFSGKKSILLFVLLSVFVYLVFFNKRFDLLFLSWVFFWSFVYYLMIELCKILPHFRKGIV